MDYRKVSQSLSKNRENKVNHTTTRNYLLKTMRKIAVVISNYYEIDLAKEDVAKVAESAEFQKCVGEIAFESYLKKNQPKT